MSSSRPIAIDKPINEAHVKALSISVNQLTVPDSEGHLS